jgi:hypothetical protein
VAQRVAGEGGEAFGQFDHRRVREAGQHHVVEAVDLIVQRGSQRRVAVAKQVDPPRADAVKDPPALGIDEPHAFGTSDRDERLPLFVQLHLRTWMPDSVQAASAPSCVAVDQGDVWVGTAQALSR